MTPRNRLSNPYYFIEDNVIFKIALTNNQKDPCGKHYVTYETDPNSSVEKDQTYVDLHGDYVTVNSAATGVVSTGKVNSTESANTFPYFKITDSEENEYYLWMDNSIEEGDKYVDSKFVKVVHSGDPETTIDFTDNYVDEVKRAIATSIVNGISFDAAKRYYPSYLFADNGDEIVIDGKAVTLASSNAITKSGTAATLPLITEENISEYIYAVMNEKAIDYSNLMLKNIGKRVKANTKLLTTTNTVSL